MHWMHLLSQIPMVEVDDTFTWIIGEILKYSAQDLIDA